MSSIAYVTDQKMIEYARSTGIRTLNFWRLSMRNFEHFTQGGLLFFVDKRFIHPDSREKGIIGYGRFVKNVKMTPRKMWSEYEKQNGYHSYEAFLDAIVSANKSGDVPKTIQSMELSDLVFFSGPVYLSEIDNPLPIQLESFTYLDRKDPMVTLRVLDKGKSIGIDTWYQAINPHLTLKTIDQHRQEQLLRAHLQTVEPAFSKQQLKLISTFKYDSIINTIAYEKIGTTFQIVLPYTASKQQYTLLGIISVIKNNSFQRNLLFKILIKKETNEPKILMEQGIALEYI